jgi:hypothetical protein
MQINEYVNGVKVDIEDMKKIVITNPTILEIIEKVKKRIAQQQQQ